MAGDWIKVEGKMPVSHSKRPPKQVAFDLVINRQAHEEANVGRCRHAGFAGLLEIARDDERIRRRCPGREVGGVFDTIVEKKLSTPSVTSTNSTELATALPPAPKLNE